MRGTVRKISLPRLFIVDLMRASMRVPFVSLARTLDIRPLLEARALAAQPPGWAAIFVKAFALVAKDQPVLRTLYAKWPWPHFFELPCSVAMVAIARVEDGQDCILPEKVPAADETPLTEIDAQIRRVKAAPIEEIPNFRKILFATRLPPPPRLGGWPQSPAAARQQFRQLWGDLGGRLRPRRAPCAQSRPVYRHLRRGERRPDHRCADPLGSPDYRRGLHRWRPDPAGTGAEQRNIG